MRQAGILAAAGIYALNHHVDRLAEDHRKAKALEATMQSLGIFDSVDPVETNIAIGYLRSDLDTKAVIDGLKDDGILCASMGGQSIRFVTHLDISDADLSKTVEILTAVDKKY